MIQLADLDRVFRRLNAPYAVFGGAAIAAIEPHRPIRDIDVLTRDDVLPHVAEHWQVPLVIDMYKQFTVHLEDCEVYGTLHIRADNGLYSFALDEDMEAHLVAVSVKDGRAMVLGNEDHLVLKAMLRRKGEKGKQDLIDMQILRLGVKLDLDYLRWRAALCGVSEWVDSWVYAGNTSM